MPEDRILGMEPNEGVPPSKTMDSVEHDPFHGVPKSVGFPPAVVWFALICLVLIFGIGGWTIADSSCGHVWPWADAKGISLTSTADPTRKPGPFGACYEK